MVLASYGTVPSSLARKPMHRGTVMVALFSMGVVALASVVIMSHSAGVSVVDLTKVSDKQANLVSLHSHSRPLLSRLRCILTAPVKKCLMIQSFSGVGFVFPWHAARHSEVSASPAIPFFE